MLFISEIRTCLSKVGRCDHAYCVICLYLYEIMLIIYITDVPGSLARQQSRLDQLFEINS